METNPKPLGWARQTPNNIWLFLYGFFVLAIALVLTFAWHSTNQVIPIWDGANFIVNAQKIAKSFDESLGEGLWSLYSVRGWRPIIFPAVTSPAFLMEIDLRHQIMMAQLVTYGTFALFIYKIFLLNHKPSHSALGSLLICTTNWIIAFAWNFYSELLWLTAATGFLLFFSKILIGSPRQRNVALAGVFLGIASCVRPVETIALAAMPLLCLCIIECRRSQNKLLYTTTIGFFALAFTGGITCAFHWSETSMPLVVMATYCFFFIFALKRFLLKNHFLNVPIIASVIFLLWFAPFMRELYGWAYTTSFGPMAKLTDQRLATASVLEVISHLFVQYNFMLLIFLTSIVLVSLAIQHKAEQKTNFNVFLKNGSLVLMMAVPLFFAYWLTGTSDVRRVLPFQLFLLIFLYDRALAQRSIASYVFVPMLSGLLAVQLVFAATAAFGQPPTSLVKADKIVGTYRSVEISSDPNILIFNKLINNGLVEGKVSSHTHCYRAYAVCKQKALTWFEPSALTTLANNTNHELIFHFAGDLDFNVPTTIAAQLKKRGFKYLLLDHFDEVPPINQLEPYANHVDKLLNTINHHRITGLTLFFCIHLDRDICVYEIH